MRKECHVLLNVTWLTLIMSENIITILKDEAFTDCVDKRMACRFMGYKSEYENEEIDGLYEECLKEYLSCVSFKACYRKSSLNFSDDGEIIFDFGSIKSHSLTKNLNGCRYAYIFAATSGVGVDRLLMKYKKTDPLKAMMLDCIASSGIECRCDEVNELIVKDKNSRPRYSPGYGDVGLTYQIVILSYLDAQRNLGITLTESLMMLPVKSVTAIIGIE